MKDERMIAIMGFAFFTTMAGIYTAGFPVNASTALAAFFSASIQAGLALFSEWKQETDGAGKLTSIIALGLVH